MKSILFAAAALLASPVIAQTTPPADPAAQTAPADQAAPADPAAPMAAPAPAGGVTFGQPTVTPPTPAPATYPVCSKTVKDGCRNRGGK